MVESLPISALHIANERFLVASTIERCPKTMMLRELVTNAVEAAASAEGERLVRIEAKLIGGSPKLSIWNTGPGMDAAELHSICDLASSLRKQNALDRNFGMGAKVASLPSNRQGVRYRSCRGGVVSEVLMGQREGIYGRIPYRRGANAVESEVDDVTSACVSEGYALGTDWTEVALFGNEPGQNTVLNPYNGNPGVPRNWVHANLSKRFFRFPSDVRLLLDASVTGQGETVFVPASERLPNLTRFESVTTSGGVTIHFCYSAEVTDSDEHPICGKGVVVFRGEMYAAREAQDWLIDSPLFGLAFGAPHFGIYVELPDNYAAVPDMYRQFLRFRDGEQRQIALGEFAALVRASMPRWVAELVASYGPQPAGYLDELSAELQDLINQFEIPAEPVPRLHPSVAAASGQEARKTKRLASPPKIISLREAEQVEERDLVGKAARYYPATHEVYLNLQYVAVPRLAKHLVGAFEPLTRHPGLPAMAQNVAEWAITRGVSRAVIHSLGKKQAGWSTESIEKSRSPEALTILADETGLAVEPAQQRLAQMLHLAPPRDTASAAVPVQPDWDAEALQAAQVAEQAIKAGTMNPVPFIRRASVIEARRGNRDAALLWAERAIEADPKDASSYVHLGQLQLDFRDHQGARDTAEKALSLGSTAPASLLRLLSKIENISGRPSSAVAHARQALEADPTDTWSYLLLSDLLLALDDLEGAEGTLRAGVEKAPASKPLFLRRLSALEARRGNSDIALELAAEAVALDPSSAQANVDHAQLLLRLGDIDGAEHVTRQALTENVDQPAKLYSQLSAIELHRGNLGAAVSMARKACTVDSSDPWLSLRLLDALMRAGHLAEARQHATQSAEWYPSQRSIFVRRLAEIEKRASNEEAAVQLARQVLEQDPTDAETAVWLSDLLLKLGRLDEAQDVLSASLATASANPSRRVLRISLLERRRGNLEEAIRLVRGVVADDPSNPANHQSLSDLLIEAGDPDGAESAILAGLQLGGQDSTPFWRRLSTVAAMRRDFPKAMELATRAVEERPDDVNSTLHLAQLRVRLGDLEGAETFVESRLASAPAPSHFLLRQLASIRLQRKDYAGAMEAADRGIGISPETPSLYELYIQAAIQRNDLQSAEEGVRRALARSVPISTKFESLMASSDAA